MNGARTATTPDIYNKRHKYLTCGYVMYCENLVVHIPPILAIIGYFAYPTQYRISPAALYTGSILHNSALILFSAWSFVSLSKIIYREGVVIQSYYYFQNPEFDRILYFFHLSKYYEFLDTFLLYLNGKTPIFLQKYHHIGALVCWHLFYVYKVDGIWIPTVANAFVHTVMYSYYLGCLLKINVVRFLKKYITCLQLCQLWGTMVLCNVLYYQVETEQRRRLIWVCNFYNFGLIYGFSCFFYKNYLKRH